MKRVLRVQALLEMMRGTMMTEENGIGCQGVEGALVNTQAVFFYQKTQHIFTRKHNTFLGPVACQQQHGIKNTTRD